MTTYSFFTLLSLGLTPLTIVSGIGVLILFSPAALAALKKKEKTDVNWLIIGVVISFSSGILENMYWGVYWTAKYLALQMEFDMIANGVWVNAILRQGSAIVAGLCHIKGGSIAKELTHKVVLYGLGLSFIFLAGLIYLDGRL